MNEDKPKPTEVDETELDQASGGLDGPGGTTVAAAESDQPAGRNVRHRSFAIVDRSNL